MIGDRSSTLHAADRWTHRQAIQIVAQLPDETDAALAVLDRARRLLTCWDRIEAGTTAELVHLPREGRAAT